MSPTTVLKPPVPPLVDGDRLTRDEFERRYFAMPKHVKAELIEGVVYRASPVGPVHALPQFDLITCLGVDKASTPGIAGADNMTARLDATNEPQPDIMLYVRPELGGQLKVGSDGYLEGPPELAVEIAGSSVRRDLGPRKTAYARAGVLEYIVWRAADREIDWFILRKKKYTTLAAGADGVIRSEVFPGLWLDAQAILRDDLLAALDVLKQGVASPEHAAFVAALQARHTPPT
jgi:Uma2 family endonuclease